MDWERKLLKVDLDELRSAMEDSSWEHAYYLDLETGEILSMSDHVDDEETEKLRNDIEANLDRYEPIPKTESYEGYKDMEDFIVTVEDDHLAELLKVEIDGKGAFRRFKDVLADYPEEQGRWFGFKDERMQERALEWLEAVGARLLAE